MRVRVVSAFCLGRVGDVFEGMLIDLPEAEAQYKIRQGFCVAVTDDEALPPGSTVIATPEGGGSGLKHFTTRDPRPASGDPKPPRTRRGTRKG